MHLLHFILLSFSITHSLHRLTQALLRTAQSLTLSKTGILSEIPVLMLKIRAGEVNKMESKITLTLVAAGLSPLYIYLLILYLLDCPNESLWLNTG